MRADFQQDELYPIFQVIVYSCAALAAAALLYNYYRQGMYSLVLGSAVAIPAFLFSALAIYINRHQRHYFRVNYALIVLLAALGLYQLPSYPALMLHYLYALPLLCFFVLPLYVATVINLIIGLSLVSILSWQQGWPVGLRTGTNFGLLLGAAWSFAYLTLLKGWSLKRLALTDHFSGAYNYRHFLHALEREIARSHSSGKEVSLIALQVDDYPILLDIYGNQVITDFLPSFVDNTQQMIRTEDEIFRLDEDLFVLLLPNCSEEHANILMERIKQGLQEQTWKPINEISLVVTALGVRVGESGREVENRLLSRLKKQRLTQLAMTAFAEKKD